MQKRDKLEAMLRKITDKQFNAVWKDTYGYCIATITFPVWRQLEFPVEGG